MGHQDQFPFHQRGGSGAARREDWPRDLLPSAASDGWADRIHGQRQLAPGESGKHQPLDADDVNRRTRARFGDSLSSDTLSSAA
jgi:hypothetical protein